MTREKPSISGRLMRTPFAQALVAEVQMETQAHARFAGAKPVDGERPEDDACQAAPGDRRHAERPEQQHPAHNHADVVDKRRECLQGELLARQQHGAKDAADKKEQLPGQDDAGEMDAERNLGGVAAEAREEDVDVEGGEQLGQQHGRAQHQHHGRKDDRQRFFSLGFTPGLAVARQHGHKGDGGGAADQEVGDVVRQLEHGGKGNQRPASGRAGARCT